MASLEKRVERLEERFRIYHGYPDEQRWREEVMAEARRRLSRIELKVLLEVLKTYEAHPDLSPAEVWHLLTDTQRAMESEWRRTVREVKRDLEAPAN